MSLMPDIARSYRRPVAVMRARLERADERHAIGVLAVACLLVFAAQWPIHARAAHLAPDIPLGGRLAGAAVAWFMIAPLLLYGLGAISHLIARAMGGKCRFFDARFALFWALLAAAPLWLLWGLAEGFLGAGAQSSLVSALAFAAFLVFWLAGLISVERDPVHPQKAA